MYWDNVGRAPRGPAPPLFIIRIVCEIRSVTTRIQREMKGGKYPGETRHPLQYNVYEPQNAKRSENEADRKSHTRTHHRTHSVQRGFRRSEGLCIYVLTLEGKTRERHTNLTVKRVFFLV